MCSSSNLSVVSSEYIRGRVSLLIRPLSSDDGKLLNRPLAIQPITPYEESRISKGMTARYGDCILGRLVEPKALGSSYERLFNFRIIVNIAQN